MLAQATSARTTAWLDVGGVRVQQPTSGGRAAGVFGGGVWHARDRASIAAEASVTAAQDSVSAAQYIVRASLLATTRTRTDLDASATTNGIVLPGSNGNRSAMLRQFWRVGALELFGSAGAGRTSRLRTASAGHAFALGAEWQRNAAGGTWRVGSSLQRSYTDDFQLMEASGITLSRRASRYTLNDVNAHLSFQRGVLWLDAQRAWRRGVGATVGNASNINLSAAITTSASTMVIVQTGKQFADVVRGVPQARYTGVGVRWSPTRSRSVRAVMRSAGDTRAAPRSGVILVPDRRGDEVLLQRSEGVGTVTITVSAKAQAVVEIASSHSDWQPVRVAARGDQFVHQLTLPSGTHRISVRIDGGEWRAPRGLVPVNDEFGGKAGVVVIP